jgi:hypothetical protein
MFNWFKKQSPTPNSSYIVLEMDQYTNLFVKLHLRHGMSQEEAIALSHVVYYLNKGKMFPLIKKAFQQEQGEFAPMLSQLLENMTEFNESENSPLIKPTQVFVQKDQSDNDD